MPVQTPTFEYDSSSRVETCHQQILFMQMDRTSFLTDAFGELDRKLLYAGLPSTTQSVMEESTLYPLKKKLGEGF